MISNVRNYVNDRINLVKLETVETIGRVASRIVYFMMLLVFALFFILLLSFAGAYFFSKLVGFGFGFLIMSGIYLLLAGLLMMFRKQVQNMIVNIAIEASLSEDDKPKSED
ncbi:MAG: phage holin family protein [Weeksellaceae bacterium]|nr:phage holin family protein [Weeksellaceae bacterium]